MLTFRIYKSLLFLVANQIPALFGGGSCCCFTVPHPPLYLQACRSFACCFLPCILAFYLFCSSSLSRFRFWLRLFHPVVVFLWFWCCLLGFGFWCDSFSISYAFDTYADITVLVLSEVYLVTGTIFNSFSFCLTFTLFSFLFKYLSDNRTKEAYPHPSHQGT